MKQKKLLYFNIFGILYFVFFEQFIQLLFGIDKSSLFALFLYPFALINICYNYEWRKLAITGPILIWLILCIYADINGTIQGHLPWYQPDQGIMVNTNVTFRYFFQAIFIPYTVMVSACWCYLKKPCTFLRITIIFFVLYAIMVFMFDTSKGTDSSRFSDIAGNSGALRMMTAIFLCVLAWTYRYISLKKTAIIIAISITLILAIQTRKALIGAAIIIFCTLLSRTHIKKPSTWLLLLVSFIIIFFTIEYILLNTSIGERFAEVQDQGFNANMTNIKFLDFLGDRAAHYYWGYFVWLKYPIFGVGYNNASYYTGLSVQLHTEYWVQLVENGIIGFTLYLTFLWKLTRPILQQIIQNKEKYAVSIICLGALVCIMFISLTAWTWQFPHYFIIFGIIAAEGLKAKNYDNKQIKCNKK